MIPVATNRATCKSHWRAVGFRTLRLLPLDVSGKGAIFSVSSDTNESVVYLRVQDRVAGAGLQMKRVESKAVENWLGQSARNIERLLISLEFKL